MKKNSTKRSTKSLGKMNILVIHGPNLNLLGEREPEIYGALTLKEINSKLQAYAKKKSVTLKVFQSNGEGEIIDKIQRERKWAHGLVINPGAYTHYSYAIRDAVAGVSVPTIEVHLSNIQAREEFRKVSVIRAVCQNQISGMGWEGYVKAIDELLESKYAR